MGFLVAPQFAARMLAYSPMNERIASPCLQVGETVLTIVAVQITQLF